MGEALLFQILIVIVILAFVVERILVVPFESTQFKAFFDTGSRKEITAFLLALAFCYALNLDLLEGLRSYLGEATATGQGPADASPETDQKDKPETTTSLGYLFSLLGILASAAVVAGGSKGAIKLFQDILGFSREAQKLKRQAIQESQQAEVERAKLELERIRVDKQLLSAKLEADLARFEAEKTVNRITRKRAVADLGDIRSVPSPINRALETRRRMLDSQL